MDKFTKAYLVVISEQTFKNVVTVTMLDDMNYTPTEEENKHVIDDCTKYGVGYEREDNGWKFWVDILRVENLKKVLMNNWRVSDGVDGALEGIEPAFDEAKDLEGNRMDFRQFFADEIRRSGYESAY